MNFKFCPHCGKPLPTDEQPPKTCNRKSDDGRACNLPWDHVCPHSYELDDYSDEDHIGAQG